MQSEPHSKWPFCAIPWHSTASKPEGSRVASSSFSSAQLLELGAKLSLVRVLRMHPHPKVELTLHHWPTFTLSGSRATSLRSIVRKTSNLPGPLLCLHRAKLMLHVVVRVLENGTDPLLPLHRPLNAIGQPFSGHAPGLYGALGEEHAWCASASCCTCETSQV